MFQLSSGVVTSGHIADGAVNTNNIASGAVSSEKLADGSVLTAAIASGQVTSEKLGDGSVLSGAVASGQIGAYHLASGVMFTLSSGAITSGYIGDAAVVSGSIASGSIDAIHMVSGTLFNVVDASAGRILTSLASGANGATAETNLTYQSGTLTAASVGSGTTVFSVTGQSGTLFSVTDTVSDQVLTVNDNAANPVLIVSTDSYVKILSGVHTGKTADDIVFSVADTVGQGGIFDYCVTESGGARRVGTIMAVWNSGSDTVDYTESSTNDLGGSTTGIYFEAAIASNNFELTAKITAGTWDIKLSARLLS